MNTNETVNSKLLYFSFEFTNWWYLFLTGLYALTKFLIFFLVLQKQVQTLSVDHSNNSKKENKIILLIIFMNIIINTSSGSSGRVRGGAEKHEIYAAAFGGHLFYDLFSQSWGAWPPRPPGSATKHQ